MYICECLCIFIYLIFDNIMIYFQIERPASNKIEGRGIIHDSPRLLRQEYKTLNYKFEDMLFH